MRSVLEGLLIASGIALSIAFALFCIAWVTLLPALGLFWLLGWLK